MLDILMSLQAKDNLFENFIAIDKIYFASVLPSNMEFQLEFGSASRKYPLCKVFRFAKFEPILLKNVLSL